MSARLQFILSKTYHGILFYGWYVLVYSWLRWVLKPNKQAPWVIGGHRGRLYEDNSALLHQYLLKNTSQKVLWIAANSALVRDFRKKGIPVLVKHSFFARVALMRAPVLIYSHGQDDLDDHFLYVQKNGLGLRIYLNHSMNILKAGQCYNDLYERMDPEEQKAFQNRITFFDWFLCSSEIERTYARRSFPHLADRILLGGGAHLDYFMERKDVAEKNKEIFYFPTFRDKAVRPRQSLEDVLLQLVGHRRLQDWLAKTGYTFVVGWHINTGSRSWTISKDLPSSIQFVAPDSIKQHLLRCELLISDYSGVQGDYLCLDKPILHFPYDLEEYLRVRRLYIDYNEFAYGKVVKTVDELVHCLEEGGWNSPEYQAKRDHWRKLYFPTHEPVYSQSTYRQIQSLLAKGS